MKTILGYSAKATINILNNIIKGRSRVFRFCKKNPQPLMVASHYSLFLYAYFLSLLMADFHKLIKKMVFGDFFLKITSVKALE